ncbi:MAG: TOBE domain-containing protein [Aigarchaeota archaeon]|nr:TOBE domain-containing protein [Aigarchaeota archaeon]
MNFIEANIVEDNRQVFLDAGVFRYPLTFELAEIVKNSTTGEKVILGFRPEDVSIFMERRPEALFQADLYVIEPMGSNIIVDLKVGELLLKAVLPPTARLPQLGEKVWIYFPPDRFHIFDAKTEKAII